MARRGLTGVVLSTVLASGGALAEPPLDAPLADRALADPGDRVRYGVSASLGALVPLKTVMIEAEARFGYQVSNQFSAFAMGGASWGFGSGTYLLFLGGIAEFSPIDCCYVGAGPVFAYGRVNVSTFSSAPSTDVTLVSVDEPDAAGAFGVFKPGLDLRFGFNTGQGRPPAFRRPGFTIGVDVKIFFHTDLKLGWSGTTGGRFGAFTLANTTESIVTFTPMIVLGFDSR
jgi:hypothetical protein